MFFTLIIINLLVMKKLYVSVAVAFLSMMAIAQDGDTKKIDVNIGTESEASWYSAPWVWIVGAAVFILLLVALMRGGRKVD
jgi:hypothetical protein